VATAVNRRITTPVVEATLPIAPTSQARMAISSWTPIASGP
jgi:hypothetical protein